MKPRTLGLFAAASLAFAALRADAQPSNASRSPWSVGTHVTTVWYLDAGHDVFSTGMASPHGGLFAGRDLVHLGPHVVLSAEVAWSIGTVRRRLHEAFNASLTTNHFQAGVSARLELNRWLSAYARVAGGGTYFTATLQEQTPLDGDAWTGNVTGGAGAMIVTPGMFGSRLRFMAGVESGFVYAFPTNLAVGPRPPEDDDEARDRLTVRATSLGSVDVSGPYLRIVLGLRF